MALLRLGYTQPLFSGRGQIVVRYQRTGDGVAVLLWVGHDVVVEHLRRDVPAHQRVVRCPHLEPIAFGALDVERTKPIC